MTHHIWKRPSLSELTLIIFNMELTHLDLKASISYYKDNIFYSFYIYTLFFPFFIGGILTTVELKKGRSR